MGAQSLQKHFGYISSVTRPELMKLERCTIFFPERVGSGKPTLTNSIMHPATTHTLVPAAPTILAVEATSSTSISVKWAACTNDGGSPITGYVVEYYGGSDTAPQTQVFATDVLSTTLNHLTPSTEYEVIVWVENAVGRSVPSATKTAKTNVDGELNFHVVIEDF